MNEFLVSIDPGKMSGWGVVGLTHPLVNFDFGEYEFMEMCEKLDAWSESSMGHGQKYHIVCERFVILDDTHKKSRGSTNWSIETIGVARYIAHRDHHEFDLQGATEAKKLGTDKLLKRFGWYTKGSDHARDAARHALLWIARKKPELFDQMLKDTE